MEWVETTGKTLEEAKGHALDQLGVAADEAEFDVLDEPRSGLFGRVRGEARVRARVKPAAVRPKQDRRNRGRGRSKERGADKGGQDGRGGRGQGGGSRDSRGGRGQGGRGQDGRQGRESDRSVESPASTSAAESDRSVESGSTETQPTGAGTASSGNRQRSRSSRGRDEQSSKQQKENRKMDEQRESSVTPQEVGDAAVSFMSGLADAFGATSTTTLDLDDTNLEVRVDGNDLGLLVGHGGRTLAAVQDLARVASQRRLGDHDTRLRIDVGGYREKRRAALEKFAGAVAAQVLETGESKALEPMNSADRKAVHDALAEIDGVSSRSEGDDPTRRVVISPT